MITVLSQLDLNVGDILIYSIQELPGVLDKIQARLTQS